MSKLKAMKTVRLCVVLCLVFLLCDCKKDYSLGEEFYDIGLEKKLLLVEADSFSASVKSERYGWSIVYVETRENGEISEIENTLYMYTENGNCYPVYRDTIEGDWYRVIQKASTELQVDLSPNPTPIYRELTVFIKGTLARIDSLQIVQRGK